jgi:hypothetical protein
MDGADGKGRWLDGVWLLLWAAASSLAALAAAARLGPTFDEPLYLKLGLASWRTGSHGALLRVGTMPLPADAQALPLYLAERWRGRPWDAEADCGLLLPWFRAAALPFWWLLLLYGLKAGRSLGGPWGGRLAVALIACGPNFLAHAGLATADVAVAAALLAFAWHYHAGRDKTWPRRVGVPLLWFGFALSCKASALLFGPLVMLAVEATRRRSLEARRPWRPFVRESAAVFCGGLALAFVYAGSDWHAEPTFIEWARGLRADVPGRSALVWLSENLRLFSNAGEAFARQIKHNCQGHGVYLCGRTDHRALWFYFPALLTIKLPLPPLLLLAAVALTRPRGLATWAGAAAGLLLLTSLNARVQTGVRFMLPLLALAAVALSAGVARAVAAASPHHRRGLAAVAALAVAWVGAESARAWPHGLCYVNDLWGGTEAGYRLVSDSNYDWGQGLPELAEWQREHGGPLDVWYFGADPDLGRMPFRPVAPQDVPQRVRGRLAVGLTLLYGHQDNEAAERAVDLLRGREPIGRTSTFLIFDLSTDVADAGRPGGATP